MKILWLTNVLPKFLSKKIGGKTISNLGWLDYSAEKLMENNEIELCIIYPAEEKTSGTADGIYYETFPKIYSMKRNDATLSKIFIEIINRLSPDVIHIHGTEYYHSVAMAKASEKLGLLDRTVISIQGLVSVYAEHYTAGLPYRTTKKYTFRDFLKHENILGQKKSFEVRGKAEIEALKIVPNVIGRTEWDKACTYQINPERKYYFCNETLRKNFYEGTWCLESCEKHSIFVSQSSYSIKALHQVVEAMPMILKQYPDAKIYVTGGSVFKKKWYKINSYHKYLRDRIKKLGLKEKVLFLGTLGEEQMKAAFLNSHVFVMPSSIENSPNSLGEAMLLGTPSVAADVGGISSVFTHGKDGYLYPFDAPYMLAYFVCKVFSDDSLAAQISANAKKHALITHNPDLNCRTIREIYSVLKG